MWMIQIHSQNSKSSAPGILFRSVDPRQRGHRALFPRHSRPFSRFATCRCAGRNRIIFDSALLGEGRKNRILVKITLSLFEEATLGVAPLPDGHCGISKVPISSFDIATVGTANEDPRKIPRIIFYAHLAAPAEISSKDIRPVSDLFETDAVLQEPAPCFRQETRPKGHAIRRADHSVHPAALARRPAADAAAPNGCVAGRLR